MNRTKHQLGIASLDSRYVNVDEISDYVPYTGATKDVDLGSQKITTTGVKSKNDIILTSGRKLIFDGS